LAWAGRALVSAQPAELDSPQLGAGFEIQTLVPRIAMEVSLGRAAPARP